MYKHITSAIIASTLTLSAQAQKSVRTDSIAPSYPLVIKDHSPLASHFKNLTFEEGIEKLEKEITTLKRRRKPIDDKQEQLDRLEDALTRLKGTDHVVILDSVVVDKANLLSAYKNLADLGTITFSDNLETTAFTTQMGTNLIRSEHTNNGLQLYSYYIDGSEPTERTHLNTLDVDGDLNYPFLQSDGQTFYFAARSEDGCGNYDIYATRYDADAGRYYRAENMGYPFNSYANDYMMVVDDQNQLGWFASDRYQPEGKVCVYLFIPKESRHTFDYENTDAKTVISAATLRSIRSTWNEGNKQERIEARQRLAFAESAKDVIKKHDFTLVINDNYTFHALTDFQSKEAQSLCKQWLSTKSKLESVETKLAELRNTYNHKTQKNRSEILELERQYDTLVMQVQELEKETRNAELSKK